MKAHELSAHVHHEDADDEEHNRGGERRTRWVILLSLTMMVGPVACVRATISIGGAYAPEWVRSTAALWIERADNLLYRAKSEGRNRVFIDHQQVIAVSAEEKNLLFGHLSLGEPAWIERVGAETAGNSAHGIN